MKRMCRVCLRPGFPDGPQLASGHHVPNSSPRPHLFYPLPQTHIHPAALLPALLILGPLHFAPRSPLDGHGSRGKGHLVSDSCFLGGLCLLLSLIGLPFALVPISRNFFRLFSVPPSSLLPLSLLNHLLGLLPFLVSPSYLPNPLKFSTSGPCHGGSQSESSSSGTSSGTSSFSVPGT